MGMERDARRWRAAGMQRADGTRHINAELLEEQEAAATTSTSHPAQKDFKKLNNHPHKCVFKS